MYFCFFFQYKNMAKKHSAGTPGQAFMVKMLWDRLLRAFTRVSATRRFSFDFCWKVGFLVQKTSRCSKRHPKKNEKAILRVLMEKNEHAQKRAQNKKLKSSTAAVDHHFARLSPTHHLQNVFHRMDLHLTTNKCHSGMQKSIGFWLPVM